MKKYFTLLNFGLLLVLIVLLFTRFVGLKSGLTADEPAWMNRGFLFGKSLYDLDFSGTYQAPHPGVPTMFFAGTGEIVGKLFPEKINSLYSLIKERDIFFSRVSISIYEIFLLVILFYVINKRYHSKTWAFYTICFLSLEPFVIGLSRLIHVDTLLSLPMVISVLYYLLFLNSYKQNDLILTSLFFSISLLTKTPSSFLFIFFGIALVINNLKLNKPIFDNLSHYIKMVIYTGLFFFILWPKMWIEPIEAFQKMFLVASPEINKVHRLIENDTFFYLNSVLSYITPLYLLAYLGSLLSVISKSLKTGKKILLDFKQFKMVYFHAFTLMFIVFMSIFTKRNERYIMPAIIMMGILAGHFLNSLFIKFKKANTKIMLFVIVAVLLSINLWQIFKLYPYYLSYHSMFAPQQYINRLGSGEGLDLAANYLNSKENSRDLVVASWYDSVFSTYFLGKVVDISQYSSDSIDYFVAYRNMRDRSPDDKATVALDYYKSYVPEKIFKINNLDYVWIYKNEKKNN